jgi:pyruvate formate lyase activating enzyme
VGAAADRLRVGGLVPLTTVDFPGRLAAVVFCQGCPWRCRYCHNGHLLTARSPHALPWRHVRELLARRRGLLDAVVFSGGEPTAQGALEAAADEARGAGYAVGLHTGGACPRRLARLAGRLDWVGLDIKAPAPRYPAVTRVPGSGARAWESLEILQEAGVPFEVRTTWHDGLLASRDLERLAADLAAAGVRRWVLQACDPAHGLDPGLAPTASALPDAPLLDGLRRHVPELTLRAA